MSDQGAWEAGLRQQIKRGIDLEAMKVRARSVLDGPEFTEDGFPMPAAWAEDVLALVAEVERLKALVSQNWEFHENMRRERDEARRRVVSLENSCREYLADLAYRQREQEKVERERDEARKWSAKWKALARFRGWPASKHEKNRQRAVRAEAEVKRLKEELADADACIQSHDPLRGKVVDLQRERDEARADADKFYEWFHSHMCRADNAEAKIEAALDIKPFPRWGDSGHPVVWHDDLVKALTALKAIEGGEDFSDVLYRASTAEAKIAVALAIARRRCGPKPTIRAVNEMVAALTGGRKVV